VQISSWNRAQANKLQGLNPPIIEQPQNKSNRSQNLAVNQETAGSISR
jgi:hypothetical protein